MTRFIQTCGFLANAIHKRFEPESNAQRLMPLSELCHAGKITICKVTGDRALCARMAAIGLYPGCKVELLCPANGHQCILKIHGGKVCLDRTFSEHILISED